MTYTVFTTAPAKQDLLVNHDWWAENRDPEQAARWLLGIRETILSLANNPKRHSFATEPVLRAAGVRQRSFGLGRRPSHRIIYGIKERLVIVYRVQAFAQDAIDLEDLTED